MARHRRPPSQGWRTFLRNHADGIASIDLFVVPTITFKLLYGFVVLRHSRRQLLSIAVTAHPTAEWIARQINEAFPWESAPRYLVRDRDSSYGAPFKQRLRARGIRDRPIAPRCPRQNAYAERVIGSIRRECLDHLIIFSEAQLRRVLAAYVEYYNGSRTHLSLAKDTPLGRAIQPTGQVRRVPHLGGLHYSFARI
jgi:transposase InsO family protein